MNIIITNKMRLFASSTRSIVACALFFGLVLASCVEKIPDFPKPKNVIPKDKMVDILADLVKIESAALLKYPVFVDYNTVISNSGDSLLKSKNVTQEDFETSMDYYGSKQADMIALYDQVKLKLSKEMAEIRKGS